MENMKARCWYEATMPLLQTSGDIRAAYEEIAARLIKTAVLIAGNVRRCVKQAIFRRPADVKGDLSLLDASFWQMTEADFYSCLQQCRVKLQIGADLTPAKLGWLRSLTLAGERIFNEWSQSDQLEAADPRRIALAAIEMRRLNSQGNRKICQILDLPKSVVSANLQPPSVAKIQTV
jgi:CRISPR system Cascade subunit CasA